MERKNEEQDETIEKISAYEEIIASPGYPIMVYFHTDEINLVPSHWHHGLEVCNYRDVPVTLIENGITVELEKDALLVINSGDIHSVIPRGISDSGVSLIFPGSFLDHYGISLDKVYFTFSSSPENNSRLRQLLHRIADFGECRQESSHINLLVTSLILELLYLLADSFCIEGKRSDRRLAGRNPYSRQMLIYISRHFHEPLTLEDLSRHFDMTESYICRIFHRDLGTTFKKHLTTVRVHQAINMILHTDETLLSIAMSCGFPDYRSFVHSFTSIYGMKPQDFRSQPPRSLSTMKNKR